ncbi:iron complex transport system substrate-binding protein [Tepidamorphus gemmatus]|jgi:iron complex transport system substrate-binding protein|uniref:Iron complex transport system substrate-binding protein n=1 Tax=Tepidamorphus gemmatus TaxID=747076 RepID=A0A4R3MG66_9HYPH|nr:ABC transporter substrate-binding protein [Tepidamorphus gemmatus]TCT10625.1 iron complex transport system substrate-binding protein [Tepidamorphus gemmatus]
MPCLPPTLAAAATVAIFAAAAVPAGAVEVVDADDRHVEIADSSHVVSVGGSVTEIIYALGLGHRVAAVDSTSLYPPGVLSEKPVVGYMRALSAEGVLSTSPTLILAEEGSGPPETIELLEKASVPFVLVPSEPGAEGALAKIRFVAEAMEVPERGDRLASLVAEDLETVRRAVQHVPRKARVMFILSLSDGRVLAAGDGTSAATMIELAGATNALTGFTGFKPVNNEAILEAAPDVIVMMARGDHAASPQEVFAHPALAATPAATMHRLVTMDGLYLLGFGPRIAHAVRDLAAAIYPSLELPDLEPRSWTTGETEP